MYLYYFFFTHPSLLGHLGPQLSSGEQCSGIDSTAPHCGTVFWVLPHSSTLGNSDPGDTDDPGSCLRSAGA